MDAVIERSVVVVLLLHAMACPAPADEQAAPARAGNLIANPGFEAVDDGGRVLAWENVDGQTSALDVSAPRSGDRSVRLGVKTGGFVTVHSRKMHLKPRRCYVVSWWCRTAGLSKGSRAYLFLQYEDRQVMLGGSDVKIPSDWTEHHLDYVTSERAGTAQLVLTTQGANAEADKEARAWFDDVSLVDVGPTLPLPPDRCPLTRGTWELIPELSDEFDGEALDPRKWEVSDWAWEEHRTAYTPRNVTVSGGALHIALEKGTVPGKPAIKYTSGMLKTNAMARYGYFEAKCRLTRALANNAFWLYATPRMGYGLLEIDIFESTAAERTDMADPGVHSLANKVNSCLHWNRPVDAHNMTTGAKHWQAPCALDEEFHRYGLEWTGEHILIYFDGEPVQAFENKHHHHPLDVRFNLTCGFGGWPRDEHLPSSFDVEYVRSWRRLGMQDKHIWDFTFSLPDPKETYLLPARDGGDITLGTDANGQLVLDYRNDASFAHTDEITLDHTAVIQDRDGKTVNMYFRWRRLADKTKLNFSRAWRVQRLEIEPAVRKPRGTEETFTFIARNGKEVQLTITH